MGAAVLTAEADTKSTESPNESPLERFKVTLVDNIKETNGEGQSTTLAGLNGDKYNFGFREPKKTRITIVNGEYAPHELGSKIDNFNARRIMAQGSKIYVSAASVGSGTGIFRRVGESR